MHADENDRGLSRQAVQVAPGAVGQPLEAEGAQCLAADGNAASHRDGHCHKQQHIEDDTEARRGSLSAEESGQRGDDPIPTAIDVDDGDDAEGDAQPFVPEDAGRAWLGCPDEQSQNDDVDDGRGDGAFARFGDHGFPPFFDIRKSIREVRYANGQDLV